MNSHFLPINLRVKTSAGILLNRRQVLLKIRVSEMGIYYICANIHIRNPDKLITFQIYSDFPVTMFDSDSLRPGKTKIFHKKITFPSYLFY